MGRKHQDAAEVKRHLQMELAQARAAISYEMALAKVQLNPATVARRSVEKHKWAWVAGGTIAGLLLIRVLLPSKSKGGDFRSDKSSETARKRGLSAIAGGLLFSLARRALTNYATTHLKAHAQNYLETILNRQDPV